MTTAFGDLALDALVRRWSPSMRRQVRRLGVGRVDELLQLSPLDVVLIPGTDSDLPFSLYKELRDTVDILDRVDPVSAQRAGDEVEAFFRRPGITRPPAPARHAPCTSWGCLYAVWNGGDDSGSDVRHLQQALEAMYAARGCDARDAADEPFVARDHAPDRSPPTEALGPDAVLVRYDESGFYSVGSRRFAVTPPGRNPLACGLSEATTVVALASVADCYTEVSVYDGGRLAQISVRGTRCPPDVPTAAPLDLAWLGWLVQQGAMTFTVPAALLETQLADAAGLARLAGLRGRGWRPAMRRAARRGGEGDTMSEALGGRTSALAVIRVGPPGPGPLHRDGARRVEAGREAVVQWCCLTLQGVDRKAGLGGAWDVRYEVPVRLADDTVTPVLAAAWRTGNTLDAQPSDAHIAVVPDFCCEVVDPAAPAAARLRQLARAGVNWLWQIDPAQRRIDAYANVEARWQHVATATDMRGARLPPPFEREYMASPWWCPR